MIIRQYVCPKCGSEYFFASDEDYSEICHKCGEELSLVKISNGYGLVLSEDTNGKGLIETPNEQNEKSNADKIVVGREAASETEQPQPKKVKIKKYIVFAAILSAFYFTAIRFSLYYSPKIEKDTLQELQIVNTQIPIGTVYEVPEGEYECGVDFPPGRYVIIYGKGSLFGGYVISKSSCKYLATIVQIGKNSPYTCFLQEGDKFEVTLSTLYFKKITMQPNREYLRSDGSYILGRGYFFEGIDIPEGKYDIKTLDDNSSGTTIRAKTKKYIRLSKGESYHNLKLKNKGSVIKISSGSAQFVPIQ